MRTILKICILLLFSVGMLCEVVAQSVTGVQGRVRDAQTNEPIPFVQIVFDGTIIGTETDMDGHFTLSNNQGYTSVSFRMMGYEPQTIKLERGKTKKRLTVKLYPKSKTLGAVEIKAKRGRQKYSRKHNPAVELVRKVIDHKEQNRLENISRYHRNVYERLSMSLDDFNPDFEGKRLWRKVNFLEKYIDETEFDATPILMVSMREVLAEESYRKSPSQRRRMITGKRMEGLDEVISDEGLESNIQAMFSPVDIYNGDIELMLNHFVSPLSPVLAVTFYKYFITDTTEVNGQRCVELSFVPANQQSYGFTGRMYISLDPDSTFALTKYVMAVSPHVNLNFVRDLTVVQTFTRSDEGRWLPNRCDTYGRMYINKHLQELYVHQMRLYTEYQLGDTAELLPDSLFSVFTHEAELPGADKVYRAEFDERRPIKLTAKQTVLDSMWVELNRLPEFRAGKKVVEALISGYIPTHKEREKSRFDIGPVYNIFSYNHEEGIRLRLGGMTTSILSPRNFFEGYAAYGFRDQRPKFKAALIHTFDDKKHHPHEAPYSSVSLEASYELETPGQSYDNFDRDNILLSSDKEKSVQYVGQGMLRFRKEWRSHIRIDTWVAARRYELAGNMAYSQYQPDGTTRPVDFFNEAEFKATLCFTPNFAAGTRRREKQSTLRKDAPTISLSHTMGLIDGAVPYQRTDFSADKRFWLSSFGHIDATLAAGVVWNRVPYPKLYIPSGNSGLFLSSTSFNAMTPMEFVMDQYVSFFATYHLKGWILNRIPLINKLRFREVVGFNILYGGLSSKNDPNYDPEGLYVLPVGTKPFGNVPYMEYSIGIENVLKFLRIDFVRRITYTEGLSTKDCWFIRLDLKFTL